MGDSGGVDAKAVGERIRTRREELKISQADLADRAEIRIPTMWRYENAGMLPGTERLERIARELNVSSAWLLHGDAKVADTAATYVARDGVVLRVVEEFEAALDLDEAAEYRALDGPEWAAGLAFAVDAMRKLGTEPTASLIRKLWSERRAQLKGKLPTPERKPTTIPEGKRKLPPAKKRGTR